MIINALDLCKLHNDYPVASDKVKINISQSPISLGRVE